MASIIVELSVMLLVALLMAVFSPRIACWLTAGSNIVTTRRVICAALLAIALSVAAMALTGLWFAWMAEHLDADVAMANANADGHTDFLLPMVLAECAIVCLAMMVFATALIVDTFLNRSRNTAP